MKKINNFIETPLSQDILIPIGQYLIIPLIILCITYVFVQKGIEKYKHANTKELKIDDYYQEVSKEKLVALIEDWTDFLQQTEIKLKLLSETAKKEMPSHLILKPSDKKTTVTLEDGNEYTKISPEVYGLGKLIMKTWIYGKSDTTKLLASFQQHNYKDSNKLSREDKLEYDTKSLAYIVMINVNLRRDLMNIESDPIDLAKLKINDISLDENFKRFEKVIEEIKGDIKGTN